MDLPEIEFEQAHRLLPFIRQKYPKASVGVYYRPGYGNYIRVDMPVDPPNGAHLPLLIDGVKMEYKGPTKKIAYVLTEDEVPFRPSLQCVS